MRSLTAIAGWCSSARRVHTPQGQCNSGDRNHRRRRLALIVLLVAGNCALTLWAQDRVYRFAGVPYRFPSAVGVSGTVLINDGAGRLAWTGVTVPANIIAYSTSGSCPGGWTEHTAARGFYIVGLPASGTNAGTVGTALTNTENRATGQHSHAPIGTHTHTQNAHGHTLTNPTHSHTETGSAAVDSNSGGVAKTTGSGATNTGSSTTGVSIDATAAVNQSVTTGVTVQNAGSVAGTNAPYIQMVACKKD
jgi:hypothetical protein